MNKRQVLIFWLIAIILGGGVYALKNMRDQSTKTGTMRAPGQTLFESFPGTDIVTVDIKGATGNVTLTKKDAKWTVTQRDGYPANTTYVNDLIRTLGDLKVTRALEAGPKFAPHFGMDEESADPKDHGLIATFKDATGKELAKVALGKNIDNGAEQQSPMAMMGGGAVGRYIRNYDDSTGFYAVSEMFPSVTAEVPRWLADDFISPEKIKSITLSQKGKDDPDWKLTRDAEEGDFKLDGITAAETLDTAVTSPLKTLFSYARFEDVVLPDKVTERADPAGKRTATVETFEGFVYTVTVTPTKAAAAPPPTLTSPDSPPPATDNYFLTVSVSADLPKERKKADGEKPEDAKTKDDAFTERLKTLTEKLAKEKALAGRTFEVSKSTVDSLLKDRAQLVKPATPPTPPPTTDSNSGAAKPPGQTTTTPPVEVTTPPIEVPPATDNSKPAAEPAKPATEPAKPAEPAEPAEPAKPAADATPPPAKPRVEAVTPPITIPPANERAVDKKPADEKPAAGKPADEKPATEKPADEKPADEKPADQKPADEKPADEKPADKAPDKEPAKE